MPQSLLASSSDFTRNWRQSGSDRRTWSYVANALAFTARGLLIAVLCTAPWFYGGVELDVQVWLNWGLLGSLVFWTLSSLVSVLTNQAEPLRIPSLMLPLLGALMLGSFQVLPPGMSARSNRPSGINRDEHVPQVIGKPSAYSLLPAHPQSRSLYPAATRLEIARIGMAIIACYLGVVLFSNSSSQIWLWASFAANGAALAFFGIVQQLSWNGKLFWTVPLLLGGQPFASYVNRNNAAGYLNLCLAAAWGLVIWSTSRIAQGSNNSELGTQIAASRFHREVTRSRRTAGRSSILDGLTMTCILFAVLNVAGIVCSTSRGGVVAMICAISVVLLLGSRSQGGLVTGSLFAATLGLSVGLVYWTGQEGRFLGRWGSATGDTLASGAQTRFANWCDALQSTIDFPLIGTGFGTYSFAYLPYQSWRSIARFYNADNQFVECLVEGGLIGFALMTLTLALSLAASWTLIRVDPRHPAGIVGMFATIGQMVSASFDFGPSVFANMIALAVLTGSITGRVARTLPHGAQTSLARWLVLPELRPTGIGVIVSLALLAHGTMGLRNISTAADCRAAWREMPRRLDLQDNLETLDVEATIGQLYAALEKRPDDADAHASLANLLIYRYRVQTFEELANFNRRGGPSPRWILTDPAVLYDRANEWNRQREYSLLEGIRKANVVRKNLFPAYEHLIAARTACPLMPGLDLRLAILSVVVGADESEIKTALRRAIALSPADPDLVDQCLAMARSADLSDLIRECQNRRQFLQSQQESAH